MNLYQLQVMKVFYFFIDNSEKTQGPVLLSYFQAHGISPNTFVWYEGLPDWVKADTVPQLRHFLKENGVESMEEHHYASELGYKYSAAHCTPPACKDNHTAPSKSEMPKTWLFESILVTLFCCLPLGIGGIINASRVHTLWSNMRYAEALDASNRAKQWTKWGLLIAVIAWLIYVLIALLVPAARDTVWFFNENI